MGSQLVGCHQTQIDATEPEYLVCVGNELVGCHQTLIDATEPDNIWAKFWMKLIMLHIRKTT